MIDQHDPIIGIDLGTTNSLVALCTQAGPFVIKGVDEGGDSGLVPSVVHFPPGGASGDVWVGAAAQAQLVTHPTRTIHSIKRLMGMGLADAAAEQAHVSYAIVGSSAGDTGLGEGAVPPGGGAGDLACVEVDGRLYSPQEVSAMILREVRRRAERHLGRSVRRAVITVPAYFNDAQRQATRDAGKIAGLEVLRIISEPTAAALAYGLAERRPGRHAERSGATAAVAKSDVRVGTVSLAVGDKTKCLATSAERNEPASQPTAGAALPSHTESATAVPLEDHLVAVYDLGGGTFDVSILQLVTVEGESTFQVLSTHGDTHLGGDDFDRAMMDLLAGEVGHVGDGQQPQLAGGPSASPWQTWPAGQVAGLRAAAIRTKHALSELPLVVAEFERPVVGAGGAVEVVRRPVSREDFEAAVAPLIDRTVASCRQALADARVSVEQIREVVLVGGMTRMPAIKRRVAEVFGRTPYDAINPDEVVALGAAVQAAILSGLRRDVLLMDVIPLSLGIETMGGAFAKVILRNTTIPCSARELFSTSVDGQTRVAIHVLQGERELVRDVRSLGRFELGGIPPMPAGLPKVEVRFLVDANGILSVSATELRSQVAASIQVLPAHGLTREQVERLTEDSITHAREDFAAHRLIDLRLHVDRDLAAAERNLVSAGDDLDADAKAALHELMHRLRTLRETDDADALHAALDAFNHHPARVRLAERAILRTLQS